MDEATARQRLEQLVQADQDPVLGMDEIDALMDLARRPDIAGNPPSNVDTSASEWTASTRVLAGQVVYITNGRFLRCIVPGTTGTVEPVWGLTTLPRTGQELIDGTVTWEDFGTEWAPTFDLDAAAARGWRMKAGKAAGRFDFSEDGQQFSRSQVISHCTAMAATFETGTAGDLTV